MEDRDTTLTHSPGNPASFVKISEPRVRHLRKHALLACFHIGTHVARLPASRIGAPR